MGHPAPRTRPERPTGDESGQIMLLIMIFAMIAITVIVGTVAVSAVHLARTRLYDIADAAALSAANALDSGAYVSGVPRGIPLSDASVATAAREYLAGQSPPSHVTSWGLLGGTGTPDGRTAVVRMAGEVQIPLIGAALKGLGGTVTVTVEAHARADVR